MYIYGPLVSIRVSSGQDMDPALDCIAQVQSSRCRPISLLISSLLRLLDSNFPGNFLWAWELHPLNLRWCLSRTNPLKSSMLVGRSGVGHVFIKYYMDLLVGRLGVGHVFVKYYSREIGRTCPDKVPTCFQCRGESLRDSEKLWEVLLRDFARQSVNQRQDAIDISRAPPLSGAPWYILISPYLYENFAKQIRPNNSI